VSVRATLAAGGTVLALLVGLVLSTDSESQTAGAPLSKEEYQQQAFHFEGEVSKTDGIYYHLAIDHLRPPKCAAGVRRYHRRLAALVDEASPLLPPPEIAEVHARLMTGARRTVRGVSRFAKLAQSGRLICGEDAGETARNAVADKIYAAYRHSGLDQALNQLYDLGYVLGGE
jgi:hypothetical protein